MKEIKELFEDTMREIGAPIKNAHLLIPLFEKVSKEDAIKYLTDARDGLNKSTWNDVRVGEKVLQITVKLPITNGQFLKIKKPSKELVEQLDVEVLEWIFQEKENSKNYHFLSKESNGLSEKYVLSGKRLLIPSWNHKFWTYSHIIVLPERLFGSLDKDGYKLAKIKNLFKRFYTFIFKCNSDNVLMSWNKYEYETSLNFFHLEKLLSYLLQMFLTDKFNDIKFSMDTTFYLNRIDVFKNEYKIYPVRKSDHCTYYGIQGVSPTNIRITLPYIYSIKESEDLCKRIKSVIDAENFNYDDIHQDNHDLVRALENEFGKDARSHLEQKQPSILKKETIEAFFHHNEELFLS